MSTPAHHLTIEYISIDLPQPDPKNPRKHPKRQVKALARAIEEFGFTSPILLDKQSIVIAGHGRLEAARLLQMASVPIVRLEHLTPAQVKAYRIADNRLAEMSEWSDELLKNELQALSELDKDFNLTLTGFEMPKIDLILNPAQDDFEDEVVTVSEGSPVSQLGDLWILGAHRLYCGDALKPESYQQLLDTEKADLVFTDPPYNVPVEGHILTNNKHGHSEFAMAAGEMTDQQFEGFLKQAIHQLQAFSTQSSIHFICMDWRHIDILLAAGKSYEELKNICIWNKSNGGMGSFYRSKHEMIAVFKNGKEPHINNIELGKHGRYRTNVWHYAGQTSIQTKKSKGLSMHPTVKPVSMIADAILDCSNREHIVLDPFGGSGSTLIAAEKMHRRARLIELEPKYIDVTIRRWELLTKQRAVLASTSQSFEEVQNARKAGAA